ncbi:Hydroxyacid oxidase 1 [Desmophyllum pertusum]|uniref:Hydroxyacid oxidase 1 n=1 Tax=Desmophyllum pertusum TaxID=174260 RepID=A0A9X0DB84_9CNID|nr:Hydroxyacid oxidase 1 [Desmophyllum pertusum]
MLHCTKIDKAFKRLKLRPRVLRNVSHQDISVTVLGHKLSMPICVSPTSFQGMAHPDGELATVRAVASVDTAMGLSLYSTHSLEDVARESPNTIKFMQMQFYTDRQLMETLLKRAEKASYKAVLLTVDIPVSKYDNHKLRANFSLPRHLKFANFLPLKRKHGFKDNDELSDYVEGLSDDSVDWEILDWLRSITSLPFVLKGILTAEDARLAVQHGARGILVSNHGGRELDGVPATIEVLAEIAEAGEQGVTKVLQMLRDELKVAMALAGCASLKDITPSLVMRHAASHL